MAKCSTTSLTYVVVDYNVKADKHEPWQDRSVVLPGFTKVSQINRASHTQCHVCLGLELLRHAGGCWFNELPSQIQKYRLTNLMNTN